MRRVVVTGAGALSPLGNDWPTVFARLQAKKNAVQVQPDLKQYAGMQTHLAAMCAPYTLDEKVYNRKTMRGMGKVAQMATKASEVALKEAGLFGDPVLKSGKVGVSFGSSSGSPAFIADFGRMLLNKSTDGVTATTYIKMMSHTAPVNIGVFFGLTGRIITTSSACTSGSQGIGYAFEAVQSGKQVAMLAGGAEELDPTQAAVFDTLFATSTQYNDRPRMTPRPFDKERDGLVLGEGACTFVLEEYEHAKARGAQMLGEIVGYGTNCDGTHVTQPQSATMAQAMRLALEDAGLPGGAIPYVNAHGTSTDQGDVAESQATQAVLGSRTAISSLKSYMGHTLGACGALETWMTLEMMKAGWFAPTLNLQQVDPRCGELDYVLAGGRKLETEFAMSNNFAFGGINTSLILRRI
ncbi:MAG TPA: beta-ketoacyl-ACP synthase [Roseateles sp.]|uniref:beta-ketoacyl-ACP synthase n=1 Tax=Roseateles sp. TaxID=1971397 RepID=UPI002ED85D26